MSELDYPARTIGSEVEYPDSDGKPMADNTLQFSYIVLIKEGLEAVFKHDVNVFVAGDLLWYPVEGDNKIRAAPDALVAFGRPKGYRGSYKQWQENNIAPQVVFEVLSPGNTRAEMTRKFEFYQRFGVEEYYLYDPDRGVLNGWQREAGLLRPIAQMQHWVSPRLKIRFELDGNTLRLFEPNGAPFRSLTEHHERADQEARRADQEAQRADQEAQRAERAEQENQRLLAELERLKREQRR